MIMFTMRLHSPVFTPCTIKMRNVKKLCPAEFQQEFEKLDHTEFLMEPDVDNQVRILLDKLAPVGGHSRSIGTNFGGNSR